MTEKIETILATKLRQKPAAKDLGFGKFFSDHMFTVSYSKERGWTEPKVRPYEPLMLDPAASVLHYGQALFEGMKAFRQVDGRIALFRPEYNWTRLTRGAERLCMQAPSTDLMMQGLRQLIQIDRDWVPQERGTALYIRPTLIATEGFLGVRPAEKYLFFIILSPVGGYYAAGSEAVKIWVEDEDLRAAPGGLGETKAAANYAASLRAAVQAKKKGYSQVLWLDHLRKNVEEVGTMNVFFVLDGEIATPRLNGSILAGGTRDCAIQLLREMGHTVNEREVSFQEIRQGLSNGQLKEAFGTGTAAVVTPIGELAGRDFSLKVGSGGWGAISTELYKKLSAIQYGQEKDLHGWITKLD